MKKENEINATEAKAIELVQDGSIEFNLDKMENQYSVALGSCTVLIFISEDKNVLISHYGSPSIDYLVERYLGQHLLNVNEGYDFFSKKEFITDNKQIKFSRIVGEIEAFFKKNPNITGLSITTPIAKMIIPIKGYKKKEGNLEKADYIEKECVEILKEGFASKLSLNEDQIRTLSYDSNLKEGRVFTYGKDSIARLGKNNNVKEKESKKEDKKHLKTEDKKSANLYKEEFDKNDNKLKSLYEEKRKKIIDTAKDNTETGRVNLSSIASLLSGIKKK